MLQSTYFEGAQYLQTSSDVLCCFDESIDVTTSIDEVAAADQLHESALGTSPTTVESISTVASKNERRKAQNRAAQRAFRIRQQQALDDASKELKHLKEQLQQANALKDHFKRLFENLTSNHESYRELGIC
ncbi:hypothetical protein EDD36DRAFT_463107 [Exophiala viscosa]|uniref:BZIP domain-containing protein n=2 Tax=Exophiala viscosa TaxID=2486360 RepID=A0AAN6E2V5_9EURO|nr:hypothetical protein EDD36DRAFT_463107 [Exophiala viscosa]